MAQAEFDRIVEAYMQMAEAAHYRPAAPSDELGHILLSKSKLKDRAVLLAEARQYAARFMEEENTRSFFLGVSNLATNRALVYAIEACRLLCGGLAVPAVDLLKLAVADALPEAERQRKEPPAWL
jgi:hypothetical protein